MAKIGLEGMYTGKYQEDKVKKSITFSDGNKISKAITLTVAYTVQEASLYADNGLDDHIKVITGGKVTYTPNDITEEDFYPLMGVKEETVTINEDSETIYAIGDSNEGDFVGIGYIITLRQSGVERQKVIIIPKLKFSIPESEEMKTRGDSLSFDVSALEGTMYKDVMGNYKYEKVFTGDTAKKEAEDYMAKIFPVTPVPPEV